MGQREQSRSFDSPRYCVTDELSQKSLENREDGESRMKSSQETCYIINTVAFGGEAYIDIAEMLFCCAQIVKFYIFTLLLRSDEPPKGSFFMRTDCCSTAYFCISPVISHSRKRGFKMKKKFVLSLLAGMMILSSFGTGVFASETATYGEVTIENGDRTLTFTEMPTGILCCYSGEVLMKLGLDQYIIGTSTNNKGRISPLEGVAELFEGIPEIERSHENAVACGADLIVGEVSAFQEDRWGTYDMLEEKGITSYVLTGTVVEDETMDSIYQDIENMGKIFKVEERAEKLIFETKEQIAAIEASVADIKEEEKVTAFVMDSVSGNEVYTTSAGLESNLIELAGGINATKGMADSRWFTTSVETIVATNPDVMIFNDYGNEEMLQESLDFINNNEALADVPAVANQNYIIIPLAYAMHDLSAVEACKIFAEAFYPERFL